MKLKFTRAINDAIQGGELAKAPTAVDPTCGLTVPTACLNVPAERLLPRNTWADKAGYDASDRGRLLCERLLSVRTVWRRGSLRQLPLRGRRGRVHQQHRLRAQPQRLLELRVRRERWRVLVRPLLRERGRLLLQRLRRLRSVLMVPCSVLR